MSTTVKNILLWLVILVVILLLFKAVDYGRTAPPLSFTEFMEMVQKQEIDRVVIRGGEIVYAREGNDQIHIIHVDDSGGLGGFDFDYFAPTEVYGEQGDVTRAREVLQKLVQVYPDTQAAKLAERRLQSLN